MANIFDPLVWLAKCASILRTDQGARAVRARATFPGAVLTVAISEAAAADPQGYVGTSAKEVMDRVQMSEKSVRSARIVMSELGLAVLDHRADDVAPRRQLVVPSRMPVRRVKRKRPASGSGATRGGAEAQSQGGVF